ncbi:hypothetical protein Pmani_008057 [Petrolisthes manimaculis]|uniref:Uncharacterized protein n=1 Tax=Petrolisthes manimaculis TaxID=1843537 RepID=A0AAE1Q9E5_9EUCA|nr:hypothetical protein Pmani_008057 [Petrolisthes manimaculis]
MSVTVLIQSSPHSSTRLPVTSSICLTAVYLLHLPSHLTLRSSTRHLVLSPGHQTSPSSTRHLAHPPGQDTSFIHPARTPSSSTWPPDVSFIHPAAGHMVQLPHDPVDVSFLPIIPFLFPNDPPSHYCITTQ